ncbi:hypothetical protein QFZ77_005444 [Paenibacillus sp. V4I3]|uniref:DUF6906 family protein n=1 Tax=Paenibacillus sp. V4I3 TaxID=3042305 RepID=UPI0027891366|nr:hypothetical protein [Paenibacillus sp. V4I3]MDQ0876785.1 hypothetical protein [Paenibacillus sp. V4I3]
MKQGTSPNLKQKKLIEQMGWNTKNWLVERDTSNEIVLIHRATGTMKVINKTD